MTEGAEVKEVNNEANLSSLVNGDLVRIYSGSSYRLGSAPAVALYEKVTERRFFRKTTKHRFTIMVGNKAVISYEVPENENLSFSKGAIMINYGLGDIDHTTFYPQGSEMYTKKESQLRQAGLYHG